MLIIYYNLIKPHKAIPFTLLVLGNKFKVGFCRFFLCLIKDCIGFLVSGYIENFIR